MLSGWPHKKQQYKFALNKWYPAADTTDRSKDSDESDMINLAKVVPAAVLSLLSKRL